MAKQAKCVKQSDQAKIMVAMQVRNKDVRDFAPPDFVVDKLDLCAFATVNEIVCTIMCHHLAGGVTVECRHG